MRKKIYHNFFIHMNLIFIIMKMKEMDEVFISTIRIEIHYGITNFIKMKIGRVKILIYRVLYKVQVV